MTPVSEEHYQAALPRLPNIVHAMVQFQRLTGCRPQEACLVRPCDVDRSGEVWCYQPATHKTEHQGRRRRVYIGPKVAFPSRRLLAMAAARDSLGLKQ